MNKIVELRTKRSHILSTAQAALLAGFKSSEEKEQYEQMITEVDLIDRDIATLEKIERFFQENPSARPASAQATPAAAPAVITRDQSPEQRTAALSAAFRSLFRHGYHPQREEQRDLTVNADGTITVPQEFDGWVQAQKAYGPIGTLVKQAYQSNGAPRKFVVSDDTTATMTLLPETSNAAPLAADPVLQSKIPSTDTLVTVVRYSIQELEDAKSLNQFLSEIAGLRVARAVEYALTLGKDNGSNTALPNSPVGGLLGAAPTGATTASLAAGIGFSDLEALAFSVDQAYFAAPNSGFMASPSVFKYLASQKDSTSRPYYNIDPATGLLQILGKPLYINNAMPAYNAASSPVVLFGDFSRAYAYLNGGGVRIQVLTERFIDVNEAAAVIHHRIGAATLVSTAVKALVTAAS